MTLQQLRYFTTTAETGSFSKAAARLYVTQPSVTHAIRELEAYLDVTLFERRGHMMCLTDAGELFLRYANKALTTLTEGEEELKRFMQSTKGTVTISYFSSLHAYLPYITAKYILKHPEEQTEFQMNMATASGLERDILEGRSQLGISTAPTAHGLQSFPLGEHPLSIIASVHSEFSGRESLSVKELDGKPLIAYTKGCAIRQMTDSFLAAHGSCPQIVNEARFDNLIMGMVADNLGAAIIPIPSGLSSRRIEIIPIQEAMPARTIYLLWAQNHPLPAAALKFRDYMIQNPVNPLDFILENR